MQIIGNLSPHCYQGTLFRPLAANLSRKIVVLLDHVGNQTLEINRFKISDITFRIASCVFLIFCGLLALRYFVNKRKTVKPPMSLGSEFNCFKEDLNIKSWFDKDVFSEINNVTSAKIVLTATHEDQSLIESNIIPTIDSKLSEKEIATQLLDKIDFLFAVLQRKINFTDGIATEFRLGLLLKDKDQHKGETLFTIMAGHATIHKESISNKGMVSFTKMSMDPKVQKNFCKMMNIPLAIQVDSSDNFV